MSGFRYPYESELAREVADARSRGQEVEEWHAPGVDLAEVIGDLDGSVLEIGGPTDCGYYFLHDISLSQNVTISNIAHNTLNFGSHAEELNAMTTEIIDGRHIPYPDNSLAIVLAAHISIVDDQQYDFSSLTDQEDKQLWVDIDHANKAVERVIEHGKIDDDLFKIALRFAIAQEVYRVLQPGGLYVTDATASEIKIHELLGFTRLAAIDVHSADPSLIGTDPYYDIVLQK